MISTISTEANNVVKYNKKVGCGQLKEGIVNIMSEMKPGDYILVIKGNCYRCSRKANTCSIASIGYKQPIT